MCQYDNYTNLSFALSYAHILLTLQDVSIIKIIYNEAPCCHACMSMTLEIIHPKSFLTLLQNIDIPTSKVQMHTQLKLTEQNLIRIFWS